MAEMKFLTIGEVAIQLRCLEWRVRRIFERGLLPEPQRVGRYRLIPAGDVPKIREAMEEVGYLEKSK